MVSSLFAAPAIYLNKARTLKKNTLMVRPYYTYSGMETSLPAGTKDVSSHMGVLFLSYGLTDTITLGTNLLYAYKVSSSGGTQKSSSHGMDDILTLVKFSIFRNEAFFLSSALAVKWNSAFYGSSSEMPPIGSGGTTLDFKLLSDTRIKNEFWISTIFTYNYLITDNSSSANNTLALVVTGDFPLWSKKLYGEFDTDINYSFASGDSNARSEWFFKGFLGLQYKFSPSFHVQFLGGLGVNGEGNKTLLYLRTGVAKSF